MTDSADWVMERTVEREYLTAFRDGLKSMKAGWKIRKGTLSGPLGARLLLRRSTHSDDPAHLDVLFEFPDRSGNPVRFLDCISGLGRSTADRARTSSKIWTHTSAPTLFELRYSLRGEFADHYGGTDPGGIPGWHSICAPIMGYGAPESAEALQTWWPTNPVLATIWAAIGAPPEVDAPLGMKVLFGADEVAEVRVNGEFHDRATDALLGMDWPRLEPAAFVRAYVIALHPDGSR